MRMLILIGTVLMELIAIACLAAHSVHDTIYMFVALSIAQGLLAFTAKLDSGDPYRKQTLADKAFGAAAAATLVTVMIGLLGRLVFDVQSAFSVVVAVELITLWQSVLPLLVPKTTSEPVPANPRLVPQAR